MIEVFADGNRWTWRMICAAGRTLVYAPESFPCIESAADAAKRYRSAFWAIASQIDHRMAACI
jgi:hypothetical protein